MKQLERKSRNALVLVLRESTNSGYKYKLLHRLGRLMIVVLRPTGQRSFIDLHDSGGETNHNNFIFSFSIRQTVTIFKSKVIILKELHMCFTFSDFIYGNAHQLEIFFGILAIPFLDAVFFFCSLAQLIKARCVTNGLGNFYFLCDF